METIFSYLFLAFVIIAIFITIFKKDTKEEEEEEFFWRAIYNDNELYIHENED